MEHATGRLSDDEPLAPSEHALRECVRLASRHLEMAEPLAFSFLLDHLHALLTGDRPTSGEAIRRLEIAIQKVLVPRTFFERARFKTIRGARHLRYAFPYQIRQQLKHPTGDRYWIGSCLHEHLQMRADPLALRERRLSVLPDITDAAVAEMVELDPEELLVWTRPLEELDLDLWVEAVQAAFFHLPKGSRKRAMRRALLNGSPDPAISRELRERYGISSSSATRLRSWGVECADACIARRQYGFREWRRRASEGVADLPRLLREGNPRGG